MSVTANKEYTYATDNSFFPESKEVEGDPVMTQDEAIANAFNGSVYISTPFPNISARITKKEARQQLRSYSDKWTVMYHVSLESCWLIPRHDDREVVLFSF